MGWSIHRDLAWSDLLVYVVYGMVPDVLMMIAKTLTGMVSWDAGTD
jgi:hypothetical protein